MTESGDTPVRPELRVTPELVLVGADLGDAGPEPAPATRRRPPLPTLHLAAHEIVEFGGPDEAA